MLMLLGVLLMGTQAVSWGELGAAARGHLPFS